MPVPVWAHVCGCTSIWLYAPILHMCPSVFTCIYMQTPTCLFPSFDTHLTMLSLPVSFSATKKVCEPSMVVYM